MIHTHSTRIYADSAYDKYFSLKPSLPLWLAVLFLSREITLPLCMGAAHVAGVNEVALGVMRQLWTLDFSMAPALPAAIVLYLFMRRVPTASHTVRWLWSHGTALLVISALIDAAVSSVKLARTGEVNDVTLLSWICVCIDLFVIGHALLSQRVRDTFTDFP